MKYVDIHNHSAWQIDDGMPSKEDAIKAIRIAKDDGITTIVATPHILPADTTKEEFDFINQRIDELQKLAAEYNVMVYRGGEFLLNDISLRWLDQGLYNKIGDSDYLLCEFNPRVDIESIPEADELLYEVTIRGIIPIVAHAERYFHQEIDLDRIRNWIDMGCYIQINRTSLIGLHGRTAEKNARILLDEGLCHFVGTDTHRAEGGRIPILSDAYAIVSDRYGEENAALLFYENPMRVLKNQQPECMNIVKKKKGFFSRLRGKQ